MLDKLKSLFVVTEDDGKAKDKKQNIPSESEKDKAEPTPKAKTNSGTTTTSTAPKAKGNLNDKIMDKLLGVIADNNVDGFDYIEFKNSIKALDKLQMDEKTKFRSAFATAQTIGVSVPKLLDSVAYYQKLLTKENTKFSEALNQQIATKVGDKNDEIKNFTKMIADKEAQIKKMTLDIAKHQKHIDEIKSKIDNNTVRIEQTRSDFETTYYKLVYQMNEDVKKIKEYLQ